MNAIIRLRAESGSEHAAQRQFDLAVRSLLAQRGTTLERLEEALRLDPEMAAGHCLAGFLNLLAARRPLAAEAGTRLARARLALACRGGTRRDLALLRALEAWQARGDMWGAAACLDAALAEMPHDLLLLRLAHAIRFMLGDAAGMRRSVEGVLPAWDASLPGHGHVLGCHAFALGETGETGLAERVGREAVAAEPDDLWAAHAVLHAMGAAGRAREGIAWVDSLEPRFDGGGDFVRHIHWHRALLHLDLGQGEAALELYDRRVRDLPHEGTRDIMNAASLLWRIEAAGMPAGAHRWDELADIAERLIGDHIWAFADLHYLLCLGAAGRADRVRAFLAGVAHRTLEGSDSQAEVFRVIGHDAALAVAASLGGDPREAAWLLESRAGWLARLGGSETQRDLLRHIAAKARRDSGARCHFD